MPNDIETRLSPLLADLRSGRLGLKTYLEQLEAQFSYNEERVHSFLPESGRFERLQAEADRLIGCYPARDLRPPLYGVPVGVKDIFLVDGFMTRAGSRLPVSLFAGTEAECVTRLKQAGALVLGKTVTTEFAYLAPGPTRNPHNPLHTPGGSSSGSAAAVAAGLCPLALGTQTIGSIIRPAAFCGVVGFKPSYGRISTKGVIPLSASADHVGYFTQDIDGATLVASVLVQNWRSDALPAGCPTLGVPVGPYLNRASTEGLAHFQATQKKLVRAGIQILSFSAMTDFAEIVVRHNALVAAEAATVHQLWYADFADLYHPKTADLIERGQQVSPEALEASRSSRVRLRQELATLMAEHRIDAWIAPAAPGAAPATLESTGDPVMNLPWTHAGLPAINIPVGVDDSGLPLGLQVVTGWEEDEKLLAWAGQIAEALELDY